MAPPGRRAFDAPLLVKDALSVMPAAARRLFLRRALTLGGLALLTGCDARTEQDAERMLMRVSRWNDRAQAALFDPRRLAPTYPESMITRPFPFNAFYGRSEVPEIDGNTFRLEVGGRVTDRHAWSLDELHALPQESQVTRHICVEGWSAIGKWGGVSFSTFLDRVGADRAARFVAFTCADGYYTSIDMPTALHPQTLLTLTFADATLPAPFGFPMKLRMPTKLGYKNPKHIQSIIVTDTYPGGYWEDMGYNWFGGS